jgi:curved DNA-binding protein CbpA
LNMLKKASIISSYSCLQSCSCPYPAASNTSPSCLPPARARPEVRRRRPSIWRTYADFRHRSGPDFRDNVHWPAPKTPSATPTPYEIFELPKGGTYSKHRFYELVKIYHPDRHGLEGTACGGISHIEKLERYRLVVLAHEILSDPVKRRAYDSYGEGWGSFEKQSTRHSRGYYSTSAGKPFGFGPGYDNSPFGNATWEDWERWYRRGEPNHKQAYAGNYINPNAFASFVILMAVITGVAQATRAGQYSGNLEEKANAFTEETSRFLTSRATHYNENKLTSDGRIKHFLQKRDPSQYGLKDDEEETYRKHFSSKMLSPSKDQGKPKPPD